MKKTILAAAVLIVLFILTPIRVYAEDDTVYSAGHFYYHSHDGYVSICGYLGSETEIVIPSNISGKPVSEIEGGAFRGCDSIKVITVPDTVVMVYGDSFTGASSLQKIICDAEDIEIVAAYDVEIVYTREASNGAGSEDSQGNTGSGDSGDTSGSGNTGDTTGTGNNGDASSTGNAGGESGDTAVPGGQSGDQPDPNGESPLIGDFAYEEMSPEEVSALNPVIGGSLQTDPASVSGNMTDASGSEGKNTTAVVVVFIAVIAALGGAAFLLLRRKNGE